VVSLVRLNLGCGVEKSINKSVGTTPRKVAFQTPQTWRDLRFSRRLMFKSRPFGMWQRVVMW